jgi:DMSO reductase anchor subunit
MLVLTQMSVGVLMVAHTLIYWLQWLPAEPSRLVLNSVAAIVGALGANCALLHLGRPLQAHRAWLGWRTSWLSREVLAFGAYVPLVSLAAAASYFTNYVSANVAAVLELLAIASGAVAVYCSAMIYIATRRAWWSAALTLRRFALTAFVLGNASCTVMGALLAADQTGPTWWDYRIPLLTMAIAAVVAIGKVMLETRWVRGAVNDADITARGAARLIRGRLRPIAWFCRAGGILSAFGLPVIIVGLIATEPVLTRETIAALCILRLGCSLAAELGERALFFVASVSPRMPGASLR